LLFTDVAVDNITYETGSTAEQIPVMSAAEHLNTLDTMGELN